jgi:hypothetical protein
MDRRRKKARAALTDECQHEALANFKAERAPLRSRVGQTETKTGPRHCIGGTWRTIRTENAAEAEKARLKRVEAKTRAKHRSQLVFHNAKGLGTSNEGNNDYYTNCQEDGQQQSD